MGAARRGARGVMRSMVEPKTKEGIRTLYVATFLVGVIAAILTVAGVTLPLWSWLGILAVTYVVVLLIRRWQHDGAGTLSGMVERAFRRGPTSIRDKLFLLVSTPVIIATAVLFDWPWWGWLLFACLIGLFVTALEIVPRRLARRNKK